MQKFETLRQPLLGELAMSRKKKERKREREKRKKMPFIMATYVYASSQGQRTHSARTNSLLRSFHNDFHYFFSAYILEGLLAQPQLELGVMK